MRVSSLALALVLVCCSRAAPRRDAPAGLHPSLAQWASPLAEATYVRHRAVADVELPATPVRQRWLRDGGDPWVFEARTSALTADAPEVAQRFAYGPAGLSIRAEGAVVDDRPSWVPWDPPLLVLPVEPAIGTRWQGEHRHAEERVERACELLRSDACADGLVVVCERTHLGFRLITRDHFCRGDGWAGYESLLVRPNQPSVRTWTSDVNRSR